MPSWQTMQVALPSRRGFGYDAVPGNKAENPALRHRARCQPFTAMQAAGCFAGAVQPRNRFAVGIAQYLRPLIDPRSALRVVESWIYGHGKVGRLGNGLHGPFRALQGLFE